MFENFNIPKELIPSDPRFGCGPSLIPVEFIENLAKTGVHLLGTSHRKSSVKNLVKEMQDGLRVYFNVPKDYEIIIGNGGATFLFDMIGLGLVKKKSAHFTCGEFSNKWFKSHQAIPWIEAQEFASPAGEGCSPTAVAGADLIAVTLNETSTGVQVTKMPKVDKDTLLCVDATSGAGQVPCNISEVDVFFFSPQKVFASEGGFFVSIMSPKALSRALEIAKDKTRYIPPIMSWEHAIDNSTKNQTYNTPSITTIFYLNEQVKLMNKLGYDKVISMANKKAKLIYDWAESKPYLSCYISNPEFRSNAVATINLDDKYSADDLINLLEKKKIVYGIDAYRKLGKNQFRISLFHNITIEDLDKLLKLISLAVESN